MASDGRGSCGEEVKRLGIHTRAAGTFKAQGRVHTENGVLSKWDPGNFSVKITSLRVEQIVLKPCCL